MLLVVWSSNSCSQPRIVTIRPGLLVPHGWHHWSHMETTAFPLTLTCKGELFQVFSLFFPKTCKSGPQETWNCLAVRKSMVCVLRWTGDLYTGCISASWLPPWLLGNTLAPPMALMRNTKQKCICWCTIKAIFGPTSTEQNKKRIR